MSNFSKTFSSTLGKKLIMCLTGLFLCSFLIVHFIGNVQLFNDDAGLAFNGYAYFMTSFIPIKVVSYLLYASILIHSIWAVLLTLRNRAARPVSYAKKGGNGSVWASRNMGILGTVIFVFIVVHMSNFWYEYHWGTTPFVEYRTDLNSGITESRELKEGEFVHYVSYVENGVQITKAKDLYKAVAYSFQQWWIVALYVLAMAALAFHLYHGFQSAFQTLGWNHSKYRPIIRFIGVWIFSVLLPIGYAAMPLYFFFK